MTDLTLRNSRGEFLGNRAHLNVDSDGELSDIEFQDERIQGAVLARESMNLPVLPEINAQIEEINRRPRSIPPLAPALPMEMPQIPPETLAQIAEINRNLQQGPVPLPPPIPAREIDPALLPDIPQDAFAPLAVEIDLNVLPDIDLRAFPRSDEAAPLAPIGYVPPRELGQ